MEQDSSVFQIPLRMGKVDVGLFWFRVVKTTFDIKKVLDIFFCYCFRYIIPQFSNLCSGQLKEHKYMVPCDPVTYLNTEYGSWSSTRTWKSPGEVYIGNLSRQEIMYEVRHYDSDGLLLLNKTLDYINEILMTNNITELPECGNMC
jgi:hypothetical protein